MFQVQIPKDIAKYETRLIGPFTTRQCICILIGLAAAIPLYFILEPIVGTQTAIMFVIPVAAIVFPFGWIKPYGLNFEQFLKIALVSNFIAPRNRVYKTKSSYERFNTKLKPHRWKIRRKEYKEHPEYIAYR